MAFEDILDKNVGWNWRGDDSDEPAVSDYLSGRIDLDLAEPDYSFDYVSFWVRKDNGQILYSTDSGCSCPSPYEEQTVADLKEISLNGIPGLLESLGDRGWGYSTATLKKNAREQVYPYLQKLGGK